MKSQRGFSFIELLVASAVGLVILGAALTLIRQGAQLNSALGEKLEMQQHARVAINLMSRDLSWAGTGLPLGALQLPAGGSAAKSRFACDFGGCYLANNLYTDDRLYSVRPADGQGAAIEGSATDFVTVAYRDPDSNLDESPLASISSDGTLIQVDTSSAAEATKISEGDVLVICNVNGCAAAVVTGASGTALSLAPGDPLRMNQPAADVGCVATLADPGPPEGVYPPSRAFRINVVTYYLDPNTRQLMRQVSAHPPAAVSESTDDLQLTYDIFDEAAGTASAALADAGGKPNQIRKVNVEVRISAQRKALLHSKKQRFSLTTSVSTRNLTFKDRYR